MRVRLKEKQWKRSKEIKKKIEVYNKRRKRKIKKENNTKRVV